MERFVGYYLLALLLVKPALAEDWPEWRGKGRRGVWNETGVLQKFADTGLRVEWRVPIKSGFSGPAVSGGRIFVTDFTESSHLKGRERVLCLDEKTGKILWTREWDAEYIGLMETFASGPRATPTVDGERLYVVGQSGDLACLQVKDGKILWQGNLQKDFGGSLPTWSYRESPLVDGEKVICTPGGEGAALVALDKLTGKTIWKSEVPTFTVQPVVHVAPIGATTAFARRLIASERAASSEA